MTNRRCSHHSVPEERDWLLWRWREQATCSGDTVCFIQWLHTYHFCDVWDINVDFYFVVATRTADFKKQRRVIVKSTSHPILQPNVPPQGSRTVIVAVGWQKSDEYLTRCKLKCSASLSCYLILLFPRVLLRARHAHKRISMSTQVRRHESWHQAGHVYVHKYHPLTRRSIPLSAFQEVSLAKLTDSLTPVVLIAA